jgi:ankyrin repeat protein
VQNKDGCTAFHIAVHLGYIEVVKELEKAWCNVNITDSIGYTALHTSLSSRRSEVFKYLLGLRKFNLNEETKNKTTPLYLAVSRL